MPNSVVLFRCTSCKVPKPITDFYASKHKIGHTYYCKECFKQTTRDYGRTNYPLISVRKSLYSKRPEVVRRRNEWHSKYKKKPNVAKKRAANDAIKWAVRTGKIQRHAQCQLCEEKTKTHAHHHLGYAKEHRLHVIWLCRVCHGLIHRLPDFDPVWGYGPRPH